MGPDPGVRHHKDSGGSTDLGRIETLIDPGSFLPALPVTADPLATVGWGLVNGRKILVFEHRRSHPTETDIASTTTDICRAMDLAVDTGVPLVGLWGHGNTDAGGSVWALAAYGRILDRAVKLSGIVPQLSIVSGRLVGGWSHAAALSDISVVVKGATKMYMNDPRSISAVTAEQVSEQDIGGATSHMAKTGLADLIVEKEANGLDLIRYLISFLPDNNLRSAPYFPPDDDPDRACTGLDRLIPHSPNIPYDMAEVIRELVDDGELLELQDRASQNLLIGLARLDGHSIGIVASQPSSLAGTLDIGSSVKGARFVRFCDAFNIPLLVLVDTPGFRPGVQEEFRGIIRHGAKLVYAFAEATVPRVTLITRKAYGGAYIVMNSRHIRADLSFAWPHAEIAVMGAEGATKIIHRREIKAAEDAAHTEATLAGQYRAAFSNPYQAAERGYVDDVIAPADTRRKLIGAFNMLRDKRETLPPRKHGNIPL